MTTNNPSLIRRLPAWAQGPLGRLIALPLWIHAAIAAVIALGILMMVFFLGFVSGAREVGPHGFLIRVTNKLENTFFASGPPPFLEPTVYNSALIRLNSEVATIDIGRPANDDNPLSRNGGGLTSFGDDILVLPYDGKLYAASGPGDVRETNVAIPDNNREAYVALADDPEFDDFTFHRGYLRYNDIMHVDSAAGRMLIASYTEYHSEGHCYTNTLASLPIPDGVTDIDQMSATREDWEILFRTEPCMPFKREHLAMEGHMAAGRMTFVAPATVYLASGDFHLDGMRSEGSGIAQDPDAMYGKVIAVDLETRTGRIVSMGHRNAQGIAALPSGEVYVAEHGPRGGDELNLIREGANYGWPLESYGTTYRGTPIPNSLSYGRQTQFELPTYAWVPSISVSALTYIDGFDESWDGDFLAGSLVDMSLYRIRMEGTDAVYAERIEIGSRIRYTQQHTDGRIVLWTDNSELIFLTAEMRVDEGARFQTWLAEADLPRSVHRELDTVMDRCAECHSFAIDDHERSPGLNRIFGDEIAATPYQGYSDGLRAVNGRWTRENLTAYLNDPQAFAPGTVMPPAGIEDPRTTQALIDYLEQLDRSF